MASTGPPEQDHPASERLNGEVPVSPLALVTRAMVAIYKEQFGRGPRYAHSHYTGEHAITCFLEGSLTPVERSLAGLGQNERLRDIRLFFQHSAEAQFRSAVEEITGREVVAFLSAVDPEADVAIEVFVLRSDHDRLAE